MTYNVEKNMLRKNTCNYKKIFISMIQKPNGCIKVLKTFNLQKKIETNFYTIFLNILESSY